MSPYFEINIEPSADYFLWIFPFAFLFVVFVKLPIATDLVSSLIKVSREWFLTAYCATFVISLFATYSEYQRDSGIKALIEAGKFAVVSGCIENYRLDNVKGHTATFEVEGIEFSYNNYTNTSFFYEKEFSGNAMKNDSCLEISYLPVGKENKIIKIVLLAH
ncbi:hypothetical protein [Thalassomonas actiniarum]|uniref:Uncharacterized protein n=1 Tax=Thalassomonas actiniarum TaxID=485447 RepID=A0AAE9YTE6_9GAMM|nr:hypothetical protein [Thalassomonas actiniarum]WDD99944.1 hypothetical protein SG35_004595 [Thalassomonas actiniarum]